MGTIRYKILGATILVSCLSTVISSILTIQTILTTTSILADIGEAEIESGIIMRKILIVIACNLAIWGIGYLEAVFGVKKTTVWSHQYANKVLYWIFKGKSDAILQIQKSRFVYYMKELCEDGVQTIYECVQKGICGVINFTVYLIFFRSILPVKFMLITVGCYVILLFCSKKADTKVHAILRNSMDGSVDISTAFNEILDNAEYIQLSGLSTAIRKRMKNLIGRMRKMAHAYIWEKVVLQIIWSIPALIFEVVIYLYEFRQILGGAPITYYFVAMAVVSYYLKWMNSVTEIRITYQKQKEIFHELSKIFSIEIDAEPPEASEQEIKRIVAKALTYAYDHVLQYPDTELKSKSINIITGRSGCGKTVMLRLLVGLLRPKSGHVNYYTFDGQTIQPSQCQRNIAYNPQTCFIFDDTILYNVTLGENYSLEEIQKALQMANAYDFVMAQPKGLYTFITAESMSGGELQRIALARAFIRKPAVLILDECFSHLDESNSIEIFENIKRMPSISIISTHNMALASDKQVTVIDLEELR